MRGGTIAVLLVVAGVVVLYIAVTGKDPRAAASAAFGGAAITPAGRARLAADPSPGPAPGR